MTKAQLEAMKKENQVVTDFQRVVTGQDDNGYDTYKIIYISNPQNFKLIHIDDESKLAVLEDLDYEAGV